MFDPVSFVVSAQVRLIPTPNITSEFECHEPQSGSKPSYHLDTACDVSLANVFVLPTADDIETGAFTMFIKMLTPFDESE